MNGKQLLTTGLLLLSLSSLAQQFGAFPPSTRWRQVNTDTVRIIYEAAVDSQAQRLAAIIHQAIRRNPTPLGNTVRPINTVLHKNTTLANGYVALGPFRSEYYLIPGSDIFEFGNTPWDQTLAVHEYRHVHQYSNFNKGVSRVAGVLFGQEGQALFNAISVPDWFFEGDAVHAETVQTAQGRGRAPAFFNGFRALWREGRNYNWAKLRNGSLKDFVPNHYPLGYLLVNYGYEKHGADFWRKVTEDALSFRGFLGLIGGSIKRNTGQSFPRFRNEALEYYRHEVSTRRDAVRRRETVTDFLFPQLAGADSLLYVKRSYRKLPSFYVRTSEGERRIGLRRITSEDWFSYNAGTVAYTAFNTSARWSLKNYSNIILLDVATGRETQITHEARYFTPALSLDGSKVLAVAFTDSLQSQLHLLDRSGALLRKMDAPAGGLFVHPRFTTEDEFVVALRDAEGRMSLHRGSLQTGNLQTLVAPGAATLGYPVASGGKLYFVSSLAGNDDLFSLDLGAKAPAQTIRQLTFGQTGNYFPTATADSLMWSQFTSNGYRLQGAALRLLKGTEVAANAPRIAPFKIALQNSLNVLAAQRSFEAAPYKKSTGLFNFHSWRPTYTDPEVSLSLFSDNILNTFSNEIFYRYNANETSHAVGLNTFYGGLFPVINAGVNYTFDRTVRTTALTYSLNQFEARAGLSVPLNFTGGKTFRLLNFGSNLVYNDLAPTAAFKNRIRGRTAIYQHHFLSFTQQLPRAVQHIYPRFGYALTAAHRQLINDAGFQSLGNAALYLPSVRNHSIVLLGSVQETDTANRTFSNRFANARGYNDFYFPRMFRLSGNYNMPLLYPDIGLPGVVYFLRLRSNVFYDYGRVFDKRGGSALQRSVGGELFFDTKLFNSLPASIGLRVSHLLDNDFSGTRPKGTNVFEVILPLDLIPQ